MAIIKLNKINKSMKNESISKSNAFNEGKPDTNRKKTGRINKVFAIENLSLNIPDSQITVILGPSGCGKTTLLRLIAGLLEPDSGEILYDGVGLYEIPKEKRCIGMVFQNYALYPHFTAKDNIISYYFFKKKTPVITQIAEDKLKRTSELMDVSIEYLLDRKPNKLSGGEQQRVAMGRCITRDPVLFLLDEPFSNLDQILRQKYRTHLKILLRDFNITTVYVTHDQQEALILADQIAVMNEGRIEQYGSYEVIYNYPANLFVAEFLNPNLDAPSINLFDAEILEPQYSGKSTGVRPQDITLSAEKKDGWKKGRIKATRITPFRNDLVTEIEMDDCQIIATVPAEQSRITAEGQLFQF